jgi:hypothetical protein
MKRRIQYYGAYFFSLFVIFTPLFVSAQTDPSAPSSFPNPLGPTVNLTQLLIQVLDAVTLVVFPFIVLFIVYAGFRMVAARGNPGEVSKAKEQIVYAIIGALIILSAQAIALAVKGTVEDIRGGPFQDF